MRNLNKNMRVCAHCGQRFPLEVFKNSRGDTCYKNCVTCRNLKRTLRESARVVSNKDQGICAHCKKNFAERLAASDDGDAQLFLYKKEYLCARCFIGDDVPLKLEDFVYRSVDPYAGAPDTSVTFTREEWSGNRSNYGIKKKKNVSR